MTIVQLSDLDIFLRDSMAIVRRGVSTARNANQSNPRFGIFVDLPEKIDYEINVVSDYQSLSRLSTATSLSDDLGFDLSRDDEARLEIESTKELESLLDNDNDNQQTETQSSQESSETEQGTEAQNSNDTEKTSENSTSAETESDTTSSGKSSTQDERSDNKDSKESSASETQNSMENEDGTKTEKRSSSDSQQGESQGGGGDAANESGEGTGTTTASTSTNQISTSIGINSATGSTKTNGTAFQSVSKRDKGGTLTNTKEDNQRWARAFNKITGNFGGQSFASINIPHTLKCS